MKCLISDVGGAYCVVAVVPLPTKSFQKSYLTANVTVARNNWP